MWRILFPCLGLLLAACSGDVESNYPSKASPEPQPDNSSVLIEQEVTGDQPSTEPTQQNEPSAVRLMSEGERRKLSAWLAGDPNSAYWSRSTEMRERYIAAWRHSSDEWRIKLLEDLWVKGSLWAELLLQVVNGSAHPGELLRGREYEYAIEMETTRSGMRFDLDNAEIRRRFKVHNDNGAEPMPFGESMFGPWDTGSGATDP